MWTCAAPLCHIWEHTETSVENVAALQSGVNSLQHFREGTGKLKLNCTNGNEKLYTGDFRSVMCWRKK